MKSLPPGKFREIIFHLLYSHEVARPSPSDMEELLSEELSVPVDAVKKARIYMEKVLERSDEIDARITQASTSYSFERIVPIVLSILRLATFELFFDKKVPPKVAISEALRLTKKFNTLESVTFVNAVLDKIYKSL